jgi:hypothetical protein
VAIDFVALLIRAEWKTAEPYGIGVLSRRHVQIDRSVYIGKESNEVLDELAFDTVMQSRSSDVIHACICNSLVLAQRITTNKGGRWL